MHSPTLAGMRSFRGTAFVVSLALALSILPARAEFRVGLVLDRGGKDDKSFNSSAYEGATRAKSKLLGAEAIRNQSNNALGGVCASDELMGLGYDAFTRRKQEIEKISLDDIRRVTSKYFQSNARVEATVLPAASNQKPPTK